MKLTGNFAETNLDVEENLRGEFIDYILRIKKLKFKILTLNPVVDYRTERYLVSTNKYQSLVWVVISSYLAL